MTLNVTEYTHEVCMLSGGRIQSLKFTTTWGTPTEYQLVEQIDSWHLIIDRTDELAMHFAPLCVDDDQWVFLKPIGSVGQISVPDIDDIEMCYYNLDGLPDHLRYYYSTLCFVDGISSIREAFLNTFSPSFLKIEL